MLLTIYHQVTLKNIWKLCFGAKLHSTRLNWLWLWSFRVPEDRKVMWWTPWGWRILRRNSLK